MKVSFLTSFALTLILLNGCFVVKKYPQKEVVEGSYEIIKKEKYDVGGENALVVGTVYDKRAGTPLKDAVVHIEAIKKGTFTDSLGKFSLQIPSGTYEIEAYNAGSKLLTKSVDIEPNTKTEIMFNLGTVIEY